MQMNISPSEKQTAIRALRAYLYKLDADYDNARNDDDKLVIIHDRANCGLMLDWLVTH